VCCVCERVYFYVEAETSQKNLYMIENGNIKYTFEIYLDFPLVHGKSSIVTFFPQLVQTAVYFFLFRSQKKIHRIICIFSYSISFYVHSTSSIIYLLFIQHFFLFMIFVIKNEIIKILQSISIML
jgi:hypothetical protein